MIGWIARKFGYIAASKLDELSEKVRVLHARFDGVGNDDSTGMHWRNADGMAANSACDPATRHTLRIRNRHEYLNNAYSYGATYTLANDVIGVGPRLQMLTPNETVNSAVERGFSQWAARVRLAEKLRLAKRTKVTSGECFMRFFKNPKIKHPVKLDIQLLEPDQVATPDISLGKDNFVDGIEMDADGNPEFYHVLENHPGDSGRFLQNPLKYKRVPASEMFHDFRADRPGQSRGIPQTVSTMNLSAERRSMRQSTLSAARAVAGLGAIIVQSQSNANMDSDIEASAWRTQDVTHGTMTTLPYGYSASQMKPEQPGTTYAEFDDRLISEQGRPLNMPKNVIKADSSRYNYASGRLDHQTYDRSNEIDQADLGDGVMYWIIQRWALMATAVPGFLPGRAAQVYLPTLRDPDWPVDCVWHWAEREHVDPAKEATAQDKKLANNTTTYAAEYARDRRDWRDEFSQKGRERTALDEAGLLVIEPAAVAAAIPILEKASLIGLDATIGLLTVIGIPLPKAQRMAEGAIKAGTALIETKPIPSKVASRMNGSLNGVGHAN